MSLKTSSHATSLKHLTKIVPISMRIVISYEIKWRTLLRVWQKVKGNWDNNIIWISKWRKRHCRANTSVRRMKEIQKSKTVRVSQGFKKESQASEKGHLRQYSTRLSDPTEEVSQSLWWVSPKTNTVADGLIERTLSVLNEIESKTMHKEKGDQ